MTERLLLWASGVVFGYSLATTFPELVAFLQGDGATGFFVFLLIMLALATNQLFTLMREDPE